ncbi:MAG: YHYH protein [Acidimicrobiales bacterium]
MKGSSREITTNDLPSPGTTGTFPISSSRSAYAYDRNPNSIQIQSFTYTVPADPTAASTPTCTGLGPIGVALNGVVFFNAVDALGRDAAAYEVLDSCDGHPQGQGVYHYHVFSPCLETKQTQAAGSSTLIGYALDGYGIYVERDSKGNLPTDADLDACHGRTSTVTWNGKATDIYHYDVTAEYPYLVGCFHGTAVK